MFPIPMSRSRKGNWRFFVGLSVLGLLIFASASHAASRTAGAASSGLSHSL